MFFPKFKGFFRPKLGDLQKKKKKKRSSPKLRLIFRPISQIQTFEGGCFRMGGGYFPFFTENRPQKHKKHAILHTSQANGGLEPPALPLATLLIKPNLHGRYFCKAIRRFFMRQNLSRTVVTHMRQDSLVAIAFGKNRCRVTNTCDLRCRLYFV